MTLLTSLRRRMTGPPSSRRPRLCVMLALAFVMLAQAAALTHLIGHTAQGDNGGCAICVSASHAGNAVPASPVPPDLLRLADRPDIPVSAEQLSQAAPVVYRSRAPPAVA